MRFDNVKLILNKNQRKNISKPKEKWQTINTFGKTIKAKNLVAKNLFEIVTK